MNNKLITSIAGVLFLGAAGLAYAGAGIVLNDALTHLDSTEVYKIVKVHDLNDIRQALEEARSKGLKISIAGARHAQGGQQSYPNGIVLDMMEFNKIISLDKQSKIIRVQSGATWKQIHDYIKPYGYAVRVMQTANIFTVGGSLSSNIHGKDPNYGSITETVKSFHLMLADGRVIKVNCGENPELFSLVIGGYGLFGIIIDVDLLLTNNVVYQENFMIIDYNKFPEFFRSHILNNPQIGWLEAQFEESKPGYLKILKVRICSRVSADDKTFARQRYISRLDLQGISYKYKSPGQTILQEYFIPVNKFGFFIDKLNKILKSDHNINVTPGVIRYIKGDKQSFLPYAKMDSFSLELIIYTGQSLSTQRFKDIQNWTKRIVDLSLSCGGTFYLTKTAVCPDREQLLKAYPEFNEFIKKKRKYDPQEIFMNQFYERYQ